MICNRLIRNIASVIVVLTVTLASALALAAPGNSGITYQGRILKPNGSPLEGSNVQFRLQIRTPDSGGCLMYEELQALDMRNTKGQFSLTINDGTGSRQDTTGLTLDRIFGNFGTFTLNVATCATGTGVYSPNEGDGRSLSVTFKDETMTDWEPMPPQRVNYVPLALEAKQVQGFTASQLLRVVEADGVTPSLTAVSPLSNAEFTKLKDLAAGNFGSDAVDSAAITNGTIIGADLSSAIAIATSGAISTTGTVTSGSSVTRSFQLLPATGTNGITFAAPTGVANYTLTYPAAQGPAEHTLVNDGSGNLAWAYLGGTYVSPGTTSTTGRWFKMATATVTAQYGHVSGIINFQSVGTYALNPPNGRILFSLKMQDPLGTGYYAGVVQVDGGSTALKPDDVQGVVVSNTAAGVVMELWVRINNEWNSLHYRAQDIVKANGTLSLTPSVATQAAPPTGLAVFQARSGLSPWYRVGVIAEGHGAQRNIAFTDGNVGIGTTTPTSKLQVAGTMVSSPANVTSGATVDLSQSNTTTLNSVGGSLITLTNLTHGGNYTIVIKDPASRTYDFAGCATKKYLPANGDTTALSWSMYTILALDNGASGFDCMITWATGYQ